MITGPNIIKDGLVFGYDADDRSTRFYPGEPTTNLLKKTTDFSTGWSRLNVTTVLQTNVKNPFGLNENVYLWSTSNTTNHQLFYYGIGTTEQRVFSCYAKKTLHKGFYLAIYNDGYVVYFDLEAKKITSTVGTGVQGYIDILDNDWCRCSIYAPKATVEVHIGFLDNTYTGTFSSPWAISTTIGTEGLIFGPQFEFNTHPTAYLPNPTTSTISRTTTQSLIDLKRNVTIDVSNLSFNWKGSPYFYKGGGNYILTNYTTAIGTNLVSYCVWIKYSASQLGGIISKRLGSPTYEQLNIAIAGDAYGNTVGTRLVFSDYNSGGRLGITTNSYNDNKWHYVVLVRRSSTTDLYVDGVKVISASGTLSNLSTATKLFIGCINSNQTPIGFNFNGDIKNFMFYNKELSDSEILQNYNASKGRFELENRLSDGLVLHLDGNNKNSLVNGSSTWYDLSGNGNNGTLTNGPVYSTLADGSLSFDGVDDYVSLVNTNVGTGAFTISMWVNVNTLSTYSILWSGAGSNTDQGVLYLHNASGVGYWANGGKINEGVTPLINTWYFVTFVGNGGSSGNRTMCLYKNGVQVGITYTYDYNFTSTNFLIGTNHSAYFEVMHGNIGNFRYYNRTLSSTEITQLYNLEKGRYGL